MQRLRRRGYSVGRSASHSHCTRPPAKLDDVTDVHPRGAMERRTRLLFSYGSNGRQQLRGRIQLSPEVATHAASLHGYQRFFCGYSGNWRGGFASVQRCEAGSTHGHVVELTDAQFGLMDGFEGGYSLHEVTVHLQPDGSPRQAWTYISDSTTFQQPPSPAYLTAIHVMLREHFNAPIVIDQRRVASGGVLEASFPSSHSHPTRSPRSTPTPHVPLVPLPRHTISHARAGHPQRATVGASRLRCPRPRCTHR
jgi:hypothetical protein